MIVVSCSSSVELDWIGLLLIRLSNCSLTVLLSLETVEETVEDH